MILKVHSKSTKITKSMVFFEGNRRIISNKIFVRFFLFFSINLRYY